MPETATIAQQRKAAASRVQHDFRPKARDEAFVQKKGPITFVIGPPDNAGSDLLSHTVSHAVPSAVAGLTSVFGMGTGVTLIL